MKRNLFIALLVALFLTSASFAQQPGGATGTPTTANQFRPTATPATPPCPYSRMFMNLSSQMALVDCTGTVTLVSSGGGGGSGTVTTVSIGNLSPLFTAGVTNPTTTPAIAFALSNAGANTYFGNATGSTGVPSYTNAGALTNVNDTNVTLTLGGNPATSLLRSVSITAGWTGTLAASRGGTGLSTPTNNGVIVGDGSVWAASVIPSCSNATTSKLLYDNATRTFTCGVDQTSGGGSGITSLNSQTGGTQTFGNDTNVTVVSASNVHTITWAGTLAAGRLNSNVVQSVVNDTNVTGSISAQALTLAWTGTLAKTRQHADTVYSTGGTADRISFFTASKDILSDNALVWDNTNKRLGIGTTSPGLPLDVVANGSALAQQWRETGAGTARVQMQIPSSFGQFGTSSNHDFSLMTNGIQRVNVEATGGTVFGSIVPATGTVMVNAIANTDVSIVGNNASGSTTDILKLQVGGSNRFRLLSTGEFVAGLVSTVTGKLSLANAAGSTITSISAGNAASTLNFIWPVLDPTVGQVLSAAAPSGGNVVLSWVANGGGGGAGDVVGPASATDNAIARFDTTTGKLIQNSVITIADSTGNMAGVGTLNTHTIPGGTDTFEMLGAAQTVTGVKTYGDGILKATSPWITTGLDDSAGNRMVGFTPTASSVNYFNLTASATATVPKNVLEVTGSDSAVGLYVKTKQGTYPNVGQVYFDTNIRYDRPQISFYEVGTTTYYPDSGIGLKAGGSWLSLQGKNIMLGLREDGTPGYAALTGNGYLAWNVNVTAAEDCPACVAVGFNKSAQRVIGVVGADSTPDGDLTHGATFGFIANTPATITATSNNYDPGDPSYFQRWSTDTSRQITGMTFAISSKVSGQIHKIVNVGSEDIVFVNETSGTGSTAANRFKTSDGNNLTLTPGQCANAIYDAADSRWRVYACEGVGGGGGDALTSNPLSQFAATTSAQLATVLSDETGTGLVVYNNTPTLITPILGTPTSVTLTNATGLPPVTGIVGWPANASGCLGNNGSGTLSWTACSGGSGADTALSNLASVAINTSLLPASDNTINLGSSAKRFSSLYLVGNIKDGSNNNLAAFSANGSAVNYLDIANAATGFGPTLSAIGTDTNIRLTLQSKGAEDVRTVYTDSSTNTTDTVFSLVRNSSGTAANNIGAANNFYIQTSTTPTTLAGGFGVQWVTATHASRVSRMFFNTVDASQVFGERMGLDHNGIRLPEISSAATPAANNVYLYAKDDGGVSKLYYKTDGGTEVGPLAASGGGGSPGTPTDSVQFNSASSLAGNAAFLFIPGSTTGNEVAIADSTITSGNLVSIAASGTAAASNTKTGLRVATSGANATSTQTTYGGRFTNTSTGTTSTNIGLDVSASGGTTNYGLVVSGGQLLTQLGTQAAPGLVIGNAVASTGFYGNGTRIQVSIANVVGPLFNGSGTYNKATGLVAWDSSGDPANGTPDIGLVRHAAGVLQVNSGTAGTYRDMFVRQYWADATIITAGTTGNQTINKALFAVNFAAAGTSLTVTNSLVSANSLVVCTVQTNDTTMKSVAAVPASGSVVLHANAAATAETRVACNVYNN